MLLTPFLLALLPQATSLGLSPEEQVAADRGLEWLVKAQRTDGAWSGDIGYKFQDGYEIWNRGNGHVGVTALAAMAFLADGQLPGRGRYGEQVERALDWLVGRVRADGYVTGDETRMYSHAFATLFFAEVYGMTHRDDVREALQRAVDLIVDSQNTQGGWRYQPHAAEADMSVSVCTVLALRAARNIGIQVPESTIDRAIRYVKRSAVRKDDPVPFGILEQPAGAFRYQPKFDSRAHFPLTAAGIVTLYGAGVYADRDIDAGLAVLESEHAAFSDRWGRRARGHYFYYYGHYYAAQAFYMAGGERWSRFRSLSRRSLLSLQQADGSWPNATGPGPTYGTASATLTLLLPKGYLPIFQR